MTNLHHQQIEEKEDERGRERKTTKVHKIELMYEAER